MLKILQSAKFCSDFRCPKDIRKRELNQCQVAISKLSKESQKSKNVSLCVETWSSFITVITYDLGLPLAQILDWGAHFLLSNSGIM